MNGIAAALTGRLGSDAELKYLPNGNALATFSVAVDDAKKADGDQAEWIRATVWGERAEDLAPRLFKGARVYLEGRVRLDQWTTQAGEQRSTLKLTAWVVQPMGQIGQQRPPREREESQNPVRSTDQEARRMPAMAGAVDYREHDDDDGNLPF